MNFYADLVRQAEYISQCTDRVAVNNIGWAHAGVRQEVSGVGVAAFGVGAQDCGDPSFVGACGYWLQDAHYRIHRKAFAVVAA